MHRMGPRLVLAIGTLALLTACAAEVDVDDRSPVTTGDERDATDDEVDQDRGDDAPDVVPFSSPVAFVVDGVDVADAGVDCGVVATGALVERTIVIQPLAPVAVDIVSEPPVLMGGPDAAHWSIGAQPPATIPPTGASFTLRFSPTVGGELQGALVVAFGRRSDERVVIAVRGVGEAPARQPGLRAFVYDGSFDALPNFETLATTSTSLSPTIDISARDGTDFFAYRFLGHLEIPVAGRWTFTTTSDDGSRLLIDGDVIVDNDFLHGPVTVAGSREISVGLHTLEVQFFEKTGGEVLEVTWQGPGTPASSIPASALSSEP
jgi:hypothetical protein